MTFEQFLTLLAALTPIMLVVARYVWQLGSVQVWIKKSQYAALIEEVANTAINSVEQWSKDRETSPEEKKQKAMDFAKETAQKLGLPGKLIDEQTLNGFIESALAKVDWNQPIPLGPFKK